MKLIRTTRQIAALLILSLVSCSSSPDGPDRSDLTNPCDSRSDAYLTPVTSFPFHVYRNADDPLNHCVLRPTFAPNPGSIWVDPSHHDPGTEGTCIRVECDFTDLPADTFAHWFWEMDSGSRGMLNEGYNLSRARRIVFRAKGSVYGQRVSFYAGGLGEGRPFHDTVFPAVCVPTCPAVLDTTWREYELSAELLVPSLCRVISPFSFKLTRGENSEPTVFFLDDIRYE
jgi:hypothetical protein